MQILNEVALQQVVKRRVRLRANGRKNCWPTTPNIVGCYMLRPFTHPVACCCAKFETGQTFQPTTPNISFVPWSPKRSATKWIRLHSSSNIVGATNTHYYTWFTKTYGLYPSQDALWVPTMLGVVVSVCTPLPTRTQQLPTLLAQQCWELLRPCACSLSC